MALRPNKFKFKNRHKARKYITFRKSKLLYGHFAIRLLQPLWVTGKQIFRYKIFLKKSVKRSDKTSRKVWFNTFPHLPLSKKIAGSRMGKGKGKLSGWIGQLSTGVNMFEFKNLRYGRALYFINQVRYKLPIQTTVGYFSRATLSLPWRRSRKIPFSKFN
jgi:large subunit ribosomal protein L16